MDLLPSPLRLSSRAMHLLPHTYLTGPVTEKSTAHMIQLGHSQRSKLNLGRTCLLRTASCCSKFVARCWLLEHHEEAGAGVLVYSGNAGRRWVQGHRPSREGNRIRPAILARPCPSRLKLNYYVPGVCRTWQTLAWLSAASMCV